jgi:hypothetical protein
MMAPWPFPSFCAMNWRVWVPIVSKVCPFVEEDDSHAEKSVHSPTQFWQSSISGAGQSFPFPEGVLGSAVKYLEAVPFSHFHSDHFPVQSTSASTGFAVVVQATSNGPTGQALPPFTASALMTKGRRRTVPSQKPGAPYE